MEQRLRKEFEVAAPDPSLRQPPSAEEIARRQALMQEILTERATTPPLRTPIVEMVRQLRDESER
ncbi:MAG: hypothetical protein NTZ05_03920 [Chloroflexi bacterium]|nr:hypothetical protein [Chloroflexota bacterium]